jgi:hypothetical protein
MRSVLLVAALMLSAAAFAQDKPAAKDVAAIEKCIKTKTGRHWARERCIGIISEPCAKNEESMPPSEVIASEDRERAVWDSVLNESYRRLREALDEGQKGKLQACLDGVARQELRVSLRLFSGHDGEPDDRGLPQPRHRDAGVALAPLCRRRRREKMKA